MLARRPAEPSAKHSMELDITAKSRVPCCSQHRLLADLAQELCQAQFVAIIHDRRLRASPKRTRQVGLAHVELRCKLGEAQRGIAHQRIGGLSHQRMLRLTISDRWVEDACKARLDCPPEQWTAQHRAGLLAFIDRYTGNRTVVEEYPERLSAAPNDQSEGRFLAKPSYAYRDRPTVGRRATNFSSARPP